MVKFTGFCTYPHGGKATTAVFFVVAAALSATCYGIASCRLLVLTFDASGTGIEGGVGCFEEYFQIHNDVSSGWDDSQSTTNSNATSATTWCQVGMGLFQWMRPNEIRSIESNSTSSSDWQDGYCVGYQQTMLDSLGDDDPLFHVARGLGIFSVILSFVLLGWTFVMSCLELNWMQIFLLRLCCLMASLTSELSFLMKKTAICSSMFDATANCKLDQGGLAMVTACILWLIALVMSIVFMESSTYCPFCRRRTNGKERAIESAKTTLKARGTGLHGHTYSFDSTESWTKPIKKPRDNVTVDEATNDGQMEVYISSRLDRIECLADDDDDHEEEEVTALQHRRLAAREEAK